MNCPNCNKPLNENEFFCTHCGSSLSKVNLDKSENTDQNPVFSNFEQESQVTPVASEGDSATAAISETKETPTPQYAPQNNSVNTTNTTVPPEINKWNWGAFFLTIYWGIGNSAYLSLLTLVPAFGFIWRFVCGAKGNEWAWKSGKFKSVDEFLTVQRTWAKGGIAFFIVTVISILLITINVVTALSTALSYMPYYSNY